MSRIPFFSAVILFFSCQAMAQMPAIQWQRCYGTNQFEYAGGLKCTTDGGYIFCGTTDSIGGDVTSNHGQGDAWVVKTDQNNNIQWQHCYGSSMADEAVDIVQTSDGGYIFCGSTAGNDGDVSGNHGSFDMWVVKTDAGGNIQWQKCYGGTDGDGGRKIVQTVDGGYVITGETFSVDGDVSGNHGAGDTWVIKIDAMGNIQWQRCLGGSNMDSESSIAQTPDKGFIVASNTLSADGDVTGYHGEGDAWIVKLDSNGSISWEKTLGGQYEDYVTKVINTGDGGYIMVGSTNSFGHGVGQTDMLDVYLVKMAGDGTVQWQYTYGGSLPDQGASILQTADGGYIVCGGAESPDGDVTGNHGSNDVWVFKVDAAGMMQWGGCYGGSGGEQGVSIVRSADGGLALLANTMSTDGEVSGLHGTTYDYPDIWLVKLYTPTVVHNVNAGSMTVYPNPAWTTMTVLADKPSSYIIQNIIGQDVVLGELNKGKNEIDISTLRPGNYLLNANGEVVKFVKE